MISQYLQLDLINRSPNSLDSKLRDLLLFEYHNEETTEDNNDEYEITVFMATYPGGFSTASKALGSLLNQSLKVDRVILHVNANKPPDNLPNDSRLDVRLSRTNHADNGKFKYMNEFKGYFFTADDDICYPDDYVERMKYTLIDLIVDVLLGFMGLYFSIWSSDIQTTRSIEELTRSQRLIHHLLLLTVLEQGVAFHSKIGIPEYNEFDTLRMVDLHLSVWAQKIHYTHAPEMKIG